MQPLFTKLTNIIIALMQQGPSLPGGPDGGNTDIDAASIDNFIIYGIIIAVVIALVTIHKLNKSY